jgi:peptidyl-prolyl cis-trans isomerase SurA
MLKQLVVAATVAALAASIPVRAEIVEQVLVKVNGEIITKTEFEQRQVAALRDRPELAKASGASLELQRAIAQVTPDLILSAVDELLLIQRGRESGYALGDQQFATIVESIRKSQNLEDEARFKEALKQENMTMDDLRRNLERTMLIQQVQRVEIMEKISISDEEARAYYDQHRNEFTSPTEITLREILIEVPTSDRGVNVAEDDAARASAEEVRKRLLAGEPFPRLAGEVSASSSKANG